METPLGQSSNPEKERGTTKKTKKNNSKVSVNSSTNDDLAFLA